MFHTRPWEGSLEYVGQIPSQQIPTREPEDDVNIRPSTQKGPIHVLFCTPGRKRKKKKGPKSPDDERWRPKRSWSTLQTLASDRQGWRNSVTAL